MSAISVNYTIYNLRDHVRVRTMQGDKAISNRSLANEKVCPKLLLKNFRTSPQLLAACSPSSVVASSSSSGSSMGSETGTSEPGIFIRFRKDCKRDLFK